LPPGEPGRRIDLRPEIGGEEAVALEPPRSHQDEDAESRVGKPELGWLLLAMHADQEVDLIDGLVNGGEIALPIGIGGELCEALRHAHAEMAAKCAVARHATLAIAQPVDRRDTDKDVILLVQPAQPGGVVVQDQLAGMTGGERKEHVLVWTLGVELANSCADDRRKIVFGDLASIAVTAE